MKKNLLTVIFTLLLTLTWSLGARADAPDAKPACDKCPKAEKKSPGKDCQGRPDCDLGAKGTKRQPCAKCDQAGVKECDHDAKGGPDCAKKCKKDAPGCEKCLKGSRDCPKGHENCEKCAQMQGGDRKGCCGKGHKGAVEGEKPCCDKGHEGAAERKKPCCDKVKGSDEDAEAQPAEKPCCAKGKKP